MSQRVQQKYGMPFKRFVASVKRHLAPADSVTGDSYNMLYNPVEGCYYRRSGNSLLGSAPVLEASGMGYQGIAVKGTYFLKPVGATNTTYEYPAWLWRNSGSFSYGQVSFYDFANSKHHVIADEFGATHYPAHDIFIPVKAGFGVTRWKAVADRAAMACGSRNIVSVAEWLLMPNYYGVPLKWNKVWNNTTAAGTEINRIVPIGHIPPLWAPTVATGDTGGGPFTQGQSFYISVVFERSDGSRSMPFLPRPVSSSFAAGLGLVTLGSGDPVGTQYKFLTVSNIPIGPDGTRKRHVIATPLSTDVNTLAIANMQVWFTVPNNTVTTYTATDFALTADPNIVRFDHIWMPPASYIWTGDHRVWCGYTKPNPAAIILAPKQNNPDTTAGATVYEVATNPGISITLYKGASTTTISAISSRTLQNIVDDINATTDTGSNGGQWVAQLVPGADPTATGDLLLDISGKDLGDSAVGRMRCFSNAYPGVLYYSTAYAPLSDEQRRRVFFTFGGPSQPTMAPDAWGAMNYRTGPDNIGQFMAGGHTLNGQVCAFSSGIALIKNMKAGGTGEDQDYRMLVMNEKRGCISPDTFVQLEGAVGYLTADGYIVNDGTQEVLISGDVYNPSTKEGEWAYEIKALTAVKDQPFSNNADIFGTSCFARFGKLYFSYRSSPAYAGVYADSMMVYDYTPGMSANGIAALMDGDKPFGWSTPLRFTRGNAGATTTGSGAMVVLSTGDYGEQLSAMAVTYYASSTAGKVLRMFNDQYDYGTVLNLSNCTSYTTPGMTTLLTTTDSGAALIVPGAAVSGHSKVPAGTTVLNVVFDGTTYTINLSAATTGASTENTSFTGCYIDCRLYCATDLLSSSKLKTAHVATVYYKAPGGQSYLVLSRDKNRVSRRQIALPASAGGDEFTRKVKDIPVAMKNPGEVLEYGFYDGGTGGDVPTLWGMDTDTEILDSVK